MQSSKLSPLYDIVLNSLVSDHISLYKLQRKDFRVLPNNILLDFYYQIHVERRLCFLANELSELKIFSRLLLVKNKRTKLLKIFQALTEHVFVFPLNLIEEFQKTLTVEDSKSLLAEIDLGLRLGSFLNEGAWYEPSIKILQITEELCKKHEEKENVYILKKLLDCYHKRIFAEAAFCKFELADLTFQKSQEIIHKLEDLNALPNLAGLYSHYSALFLTKSDYNQAFYWATEALKLLRENLPKRIIVDVLREASKACVMKRRFSLAGLLINQAICLGAQIYSVDKHPRYADVLLDYGFYLLNSDSVQESVYVYERCLNIRKEIFNKDNFLVALALDDLAYALYVQEYVTGRFYRARECVEEAIQILESMLPENHLLLASAKRVKALILEEIALEIRNYRNSHMVYLEEAENLHKAALLLSLKAFGEKNVQTAKHYGNLGRLYQSMKLYEEAEQMHLKAIAIKEELLGKSDYEVALSSGHLASLYNYHMKRYKDAEQLYLRSIEINLRLFGETYSGLQYDYRGITNVYENLEEFGKAIHYKGKMREWMNLRLKLKPKVQKDEVLELKVLVDEFFNMLEEQQCSLQLETNPTDK